MKDLRFSCFIVAFLSVGLFGYQAMIILVFSLFIFNLAREKGVKYHIYSQLSLLGGFIAAFIMYYLKTLTI
jgi:hypothetical protein